MTNTFHHIFFLKKPKNYVKGPVPVYLRITISAKELKFQLIKKLTWESGYPILAE